MSGSTMLALVTAIEKLPIVGFPSSLAANSSGTFSLIPYDFFKFSSSASI
ncbi:hypothetical protein [Pedobacter sp. NJ-S-72]